MKYSLHFHSTAFSHHSCTNVSPHPLVCPTMFKICPTITFVLPYSHLWRTKSKPMPTSTPLPHHVHKFVQSYPPLCPAISNLWLTVSTHMCHIMSTPLAHHIHTFFIVVLMSVPNLSVQVQSSWFQFRILAFRATIKWGIWNAFSMFWFI